MWTRPAEITAPVHCSIMPVIALAFTQFFGWFGAN
jgi:hypothetical protein